MPGILGLIEAVSIRLITEKSNKMLILTRRVGETLSVLSVSSKIILVTLLTAKVDGAKHL